MDRASCTVCVALMYVLASVAIETPDAPPTKDFEDWFGIDVQAPGPDPKGKGEKRSVRIKANPGNNLTELALQFFSQHTPQYNSSDFSFVVNHLEEAGGGKCDACKTLIELLTERFIDMGTKHAKITGLDQFGKPLKAMHVESDMESEIGAVCRSERYKEYAPHIRKGCEDILSGQLSRKVLSVFHDGTLTPDKVVSRKDSVCGHILQVCKPKPKPAQGGVGSCRACGEVMEDLAYTLRRADRDVKFTGDKLRNKMKKAKGNKGYLSRKHVTTELQNLCGDIETRHSSALKPDLEEVCENLVSDHTDEIVDAFEAKPRGHQLAMPGHEVCVKTAELCSSDEYVRNWPLLESYHYNFTHYRKLPQQDNIVPNADAGSSDKAQARSSISKDDNAKRADEL